MSCTSYLSLSAHYSLKSLWMEILPAHACDRFVLSTRDSWMFNLQTRRTKSISRNQSAELLNGLTQFAFNWSPVDIKNDQTRCEKLLQLINLLCLWIIGCIVSIAFPSQTPWRWNIRPLSIMWAIDSNLVATVSPSVSNHEKQSKTMKTDAQKITLESKHIIIIKTREKQNKKVFWRLVMSIILCY